jgi:hypothetical protein
MKMPPTQNARNGILWIRIFLLGLAVGLALSTFATAPTARTAARDQETPAISDFKLPTASNRLAEKG